jgi:hypothetical protein
VVLLLAWTALDLSMPALCAAESVALVGMASVPSARGVQRDGSAHEIPAGQQDDCFCCSHSVDLRPLLFSATPSGVVTVGSQSVSGLPSAPPSTLYHPPQL